MHHYLISIQGGVLSDILLFKDEKRALAKFNEWTDNEFANGEQHPYDAFIESGGNDGDNSIYWTIVEPSGVLDEVIF